jgi:hypothetical protein
MLIHMAEPSGLIFGILVFWHRPIA